MRAPRVQVLPKAHFAVQEVYGCFGFFSFFPIHSDFRGGAHYVCTYLYKYNGSDWQVFCGVLSAAKYRCHRQGRWEYVKGTRVAIEFHWPGKELTMSHRGQQERILTGIRRESRDPKLFPNIPNRHGLTTVVSIPRDFGWKNLGHPFNMSVIPNKLVSKTPGTGLQTSSLSLDIRL